MASPKPADSSSDEESYYELLDGSNASTANESREEAASPSDLHNVVHQLKQQLTESEKKLNELTSALSFNEAALDKARDQNQRISEELQRANDRVTAAEAETKKVTEHRDYLEDMRVGLEARIEHLEAQRGAVARVAVDEVETREAAEKGMSLLRAERDRIYKLFTNEKQRADDQHMQHKRQIEAMEKELVETREKIDRELKAANDRIEELRNLAMKRKSESEAANKDETIDRLTRVNEENAKTIADLLRLLKISEKKEELPLMSDALQKGIDEPFLVENANDTEVSAAPEATKINANPPAEIEEKQVLISTVLRLENLITEEELADGYDYDDLLAQILAECDRFGLVRSLETLRPWMVQNGKVYIEFESEGGCEKARAALHGMAVADRSIVATYYDEGKYRKIKTA